MTASSGYEKISIEDPLLREKRICVIDFETTGIGAGAEVIEFACVRLSSEGLGLRLASLCCPYGYVSPDITRLTGISDYMTRSHPHFEDFLPIVLDFMGDDIIAAHNAPFDLSLLLRYCGQAGLDYHPQVICTLAGARRLYPRLPNHRLATVAQHLGVAAEGCHRALADATVTARVLAEMLLTGRERNRKNNSIEITR